MFIRLPGGSAGEEPACSAEDLGWIAGLGRSHGGVPGNPLQYSCLENAPGQRSPVVYSPWGCKELDTAEQLRTARHSTGAYRIGRREMTIPGPWKSWHKLVEVERALPVQNTEEI